MPVRASSARGPRRVFYISLGSNLGDRETNLSSGLERLRSAGVAIDRVSPLYETEPVGSAAGPRWFYNVAARGETDLAAADLLARCHDVEAWIGRTRAIPGGPRILDIDLLLVADEIHGEPGCAVPHPRLHLRRFVLEPLSVIAGEARHPVLGLTVREMLEGLDDLSGVVKLGKLPGPSLAAKGA